jgi:shikimate kinase
MRISTPPAEDQSSKKALGSIIYKRPYIIEMVGVAGTGKSTLRKAIMQRNKRFKYFDLRGSISYIPFLFKLTLIWLPLYLIKYRHTRWFTMQEIRNIGYLDTWISRIRYKSQLNNDIYIIEPGSVYWLSCLRGNGPEITKHPRFQNWLKYEFQHWASALDAIIWLDAPEAVCLQRVHIRDQWHQFLEYSDESALEELCYFQKKYAELVPEMASQYPIRVFKFRSDQISTQEMVEIIFSDVELWDKLGQPSEDA